jgi:hypothetical protein
VLKFTRVKFSVLQNVILMYVLQNGHISVIQTCLLSCPRASERGGSRLMCRSVDAGRIHVCRYQGRDTRCHSNLNDIFTCRGTEPSQTHLPTALTLLHICNPPSGMLIILRGKTLTHLVCKMQRFIFQVTCAVVHGLRCSAARREHRLV